MKQVEEYFKTYAKDECFTTSDGLVFHEKGDAQLHAQSLKDNEVVPHSRNKVEKERPSNPAAENTNPALQAAASANSSQPGEKTNAATAKPKGKGKQVS